MKYLGEKTMPDPRTGQPGPFDLFEFACRRCDVRGILDAPSSARGGRSGHPLLDPAGRGDCQLWERNDSSSPNVGCFGDRPMLEGWALSADYLGDNENRATMVQEQQRQQLSPRQAQMLRLIAEGLSSRGVFPRHDGEYCGVHPAGFCSGHRSSVPVGQRPSPGRPAQ